MFTGLITDVGRVAAIEQHGDTRLRIVSGYAPQDLVLGESIAHAGVCLTVVDVTEDGWWIEASSETLARTTLGRWTVGTPVNLERSLRLGDALGGHLVFGHVDAVAQIVDRQPDGDSQRFTFAAPGSCAAFVAEKGSVALDGVSLTVNTVADQPDGTVRFGVNVIPHTASHTTFGARQSGEPVNLEADMLARYVARLGALGLGPSGGQAT